MHACTKSPVPSHPRTFGRAAASLSLSTYECHAATGAFFSARPPPRTPRSRSHASTPSVWKAQKGSRVPPLSQQDGPPPKTAGARSRKYGRIGSIVFGFEWHALIEHICTHLCMIQARGWIMKRMVVFGSTVSSCTYLRELGRR